ncbi:MAG: ATP-binding protein, partial [Bacteroidia bacterium]
MIERTLHKTIEGYLKKFPAVALLGARQVGKTTLAKQIGKELKGGCLYLDLEKTSDLKKLDDAESYLNLHNDKCIIIDEVQIKPELFSLLRALIDEKRKAGRFMLLGSVSPDIVKGVSQSLAGRIMTTEMGCINIAEIGDKYSYKKHWFRGGFPDAFTAKTDNDSSEWLDTFISTYINKDIEFLYGTGISKSVMQGFWPLLANHSSQVWNAQAYAKALGVSSPTISRYLDLLEAGFIVRKLPSYHVNATKRIIKAPKVYIRDSGLIHRLARMHKFQAIFESLIAGSSWESYVVEQVEQLKHKDIDLYFYRTQGGAECDLVFVNGIKVIA